MNLGVVAPVGVARLADRSPDSLDSITFSY
jgi:hypothetical protein